MAHKQADLDLRLAVGLLAHVVNVTLSSAAVWAEQIAVEEVRADALKTLDELSEVAKRVVSMFPPTILPDEFKGIYH